MQKEQFSEWEVGVKWYEWWLVGQADDDYYCYYYWSLPFFASIPAQIFKIFFASGGKGALTPPNQNPANALVYAETPGQQTQGRQICTQLAEINMPKLCKWDQNNVHSLEIRSPGMFQLDRRSVHVTENKLTATGECRLETGSRHIAFKRLLNIY